MKIGKKTRDTMTVLVMIGFVVLLIVVGGWWLDHFAKAPEADSFAPDVAVTKTAKPSAEVVTEEVVTTGESAMALPSEVTTQDVVVAVNNVVETTNNVGKEAVDEKKTVMSTVANKKHREEELRRKIAQAMANQ
ncbi:MAG: hypothetical protein NTW11_00665 [Candidatus Staskawiczbacteria bacterium]|nr:hypothetical protein [Candidatus Staskawiczbacteria bacterium]